MNLGIVGGQVVAGAGDGPNSYYYTGTNQTSDRTDDYWDLGVSAVNGTGNFVQIGTTAGTITKIGVNTEGGAALKIMAYHTTGIGTMSGTLIEGGAIAIPANGWNDFTLLTPHAIAANETVFVGVAFASANITIRAWSGTIENIRGAPGPAYADLPGTNLTEWDEALLTNRPDSFRIYVD